MTAYLLRRTAFLVVSLFLAAVAGQTVVDADPRMTGGAQGRLAIQPQSPGLRDRIWWAPAPGPRPSGRRGRA